MVRCCWCLSLVVVCRCLFVLLDLSWRVIAAVCRVLLCVAVVASCLLCVGCYCWYLFLDRCWLVVACWSVCFVAVLF